MEKDFNQILSIIEHKVKLSFEINNEICLLFKTLMTNLSEEKERLNKKEATIKNAITIDSDIINFNVGGFNKFYNEHFFSFKFD
jgi:hypothetical protein